MSNSFRIYSDHKGSGITFEVADSDEARLTAESAAKLGRDALYRVFELTSESVTGEQWVISWSVLDGRVEQLPDAGIPRVHW